MPCCSDLLCALQLCFLFQKKWRWSKKVTDPGMQLKRSFRSLFASIALPTRGSRQYAGVTILIVLMALLGVISYLSRVGPIAERFEDPSGGPRMSGRKVSSFMPSLLPRGGEKTSKTFETFAEQGVSGSPPYSAELNVAGNDVICETKPWTCQGPAFDMQSRVNLHQPLYFKAPGENAASTSLPHLEKAKDADRSSLRLTVSTEPDESFEIWGSNSASASSPGGRRHQFRADGGAAHGGGLLVGDPTARTAKEALGYNQGVAAYNPVTKGYTRLSADDGKNYLSGETKVDGGLGAAFFGTTGAVLAGSVSTNSVVAATKICINKTCVTEADLLRLLENASNAAAAASAAAAAAAAAASAPSAPSAASAPYSTLVLLEGMTSNNHTTPLGTFAAGGSATFQDANTYYGAFTTGKWAPPALVPPTGAAGIANVVLRMPVTTIVSSYTVGAGMTPGADPTAWILEGVSEGGSYTLIDQRSGQKVDEKGTEYVLAGNTRAFTTYRLSVTANGGHGATELHAVGFKFAVASSAASPPKSTLALLEGMTSNSHATPLGTFVAGGSATYQDANTYYGAFTTGKWAPPALVPPTGAAGIANVVLRMPVATVVSSYTVGAGMTPGANPTAWILEGVAEGGSYTTIDMRSGQKVDEKGTEYVLAGNTKAFTTYRLSVTANGGHGATELHAVGFKFAVA